ncbi:MAG: asparagine synthetase B family protein [Phycisphaerales bacterium]
MCGIAGILRIHDPTDGTPPPHLESIPEAWLDTLDESIKHRGPDGAGRFRDRATRDDGLVVDVALVHRRLSVIDHAGGHQPMVHDGERLRPDLTYGPGETPKLAHELEPNRPLVAVAFNGCIYNHRELRAELESLGHRFETDHSDTEVLVHGWRAWRDAFFARTESMHAALLWNRNTAGFSASRDLAGEKPLYTRDIEGSHDRLFAAASSAPGLFRLDGMYGAVCCPLEHREIARWISAGYAEGIPDWFGEEVPPGDIHRLAIDSTARPVVWSVQWDPIDTTELESPSAFEVSEAVPNRSADTGLSPERLDELIAEAVVSRLDADVPLGLLLSGGLDSALIGAHLAKRAPDTMAVTVRMPISGYDESEDAAETARTLGLRHRVVECEPNAAEDLLRLIPMLGLPFGDSSLLPTAWACRAATESCKVLLGGDGGDELFAGYERHRIASLPAIWRPVFACIPSGCLDRRDPGSRWSKLARLGVAARRAGYDDLLAIFPSSDYEKLRDHLATRIGRSRLSCDAPRRDFRDYLPYDLLRKSDTASMDAPLELRSPLLSRALIRACHACPLDVLMPGGERKGLLKQVARQYLPEHIVNRPKRGFAIPVGEWFRSDFGSMRTLLYDHLESADPFPGLADAGVEISMSFVKQMLREHDAAGERAINPWHGRDHSQRLYMLLVLSIWCKWLVGLRSNALHPEPV